jgi:hypothetical protein
LTDEATTLALDGAEIQKIQIGRDGKILVEVLAKWQGQIPEEYSQVKPATLTALRLGREGDDFELRVSRIGDMKQMDSKKRVKIVVYIPGIMGEVDPRFMRLVQWMQAQEDWVQWETSPDKHRGTEPPIPPVEWIYQGQPTQGELFGGDA